MRHPTGSADGGLRPGDRTALKSIRGLGAAREGTGHFVKQRITALANGILVIVLGVVAVALSGRSYPEAVALVASPWVAVPLVLAIASVCLHMKLGLQVVIEDYVSNEGARFGLIVLVTFFSLAVAAAALFAVVRIMLTGLLPVEGG